MIIRRPLHLIRVLTIARTNLVLENLALRQQLGVLERSVPRPKIRTRDRVFWVLLRRLWSGWRDVLLVVRPETVVGRHRQGWRLVWRARSQGQPGRPPITEEIRELIRRLSTENRLWSAPKIQLELAALGHHVALSTIDKYRTRWSGPPSPTWRAFLRNHAGEILACDFFTIPTVTFKTVVGFVVIDLDRRRILAECTVYYNGHRVHQGLNGERPIERAPTSPERGNIIATPHLGGLHHSYERAA